MYMSNLWLEPHSDAKMYHSHLLVSSLSQATLCLNAQIHWG